MKAVAEDLSGRDRDLGARRDQLSRELDKIQHASDMVAAERAALQQKAQALESQQEAFQKWKREAEEDTARHVKVSSSSCCASLSFQMLNLLVEVMMD